jgi:plasmid maintenance system antidote protein VapI
MLETNGKFLRETIANLGLTETDRAKTIANAQNIVNHIISSYESFIDRGHVGKDGTGIPIGFSKNTPGPIGLIYGRIQSGKTRAMIASTAMAFDNGFRIVVVMTSNINDLVSQTYSDFIKELKGVSVFTKDDELNKHVNEAKLDVGRVEGRILVVCSKGTASLKNVTEFLKSIGGQRQPMVIFDDEGDQASLDANTYKRSSSGDLTLEPSPVNKALKKLRKELPNSVYVSVTGTPQAVLLQNASSDNHPSFILMLPPGEGYVGGDYFFDTPEPEDNPHHLISIVPNEDKSRLLNPRQPFPEGLEKSILFFLLSASAAVRNLRFPDKGKEKDKGFQFLCHPSLKNSEQGQAEDRIMAFLTQVKSALLGIKDEFKIGEDILAQYEELKKQLGESKTPPLDELKKIIQDELLRKKLLVINAKNAKRRGIEYGPGFNFLIGGNTLGRGIAIPNLLVTYYVRHGQTTQIDTMHQHARMFGYRLRTLAYTRLFLTRSLYYRFRDIHYSDRGLRDFIEKNIDFEPGSFPVEISPGLNPTRQSVLDINTTETVWPGMQIYPNYMSLPQSTSTYSKVIEMCAKACGLTTSDVKKIVSKSKNGVTITADNAIQIVSHIKTKSKTSWHDKTIADVIRKLAQRLGNNFLLRFREANRTVQTGGFLPQGTISGTEQTAGRAEAMPTLWIMSVTGSYDYDPNSKEIFVFPTIIVPNGLPKVFVFSKK